MIFIKIVTFLNANIDDILVMFNYIYRKLE